MSSSSSLRLLRGEPCPVFAPRPLFKEEVEFVVRVFAEAPPEDYEICGMRLAEINSDSGFEERLKNFQEASKKKETESVWARGLETAAKKLAAPYKSTLKPKVEFVAVWGGGSENRFFPDAAAAVMDVIRAKGDSTDTLSVTLCCLGFSEISVAEADDVTFSAHAEDLTGIGEEGRAPIWTSFLVRDTQQVLPRFVVDLKRRAEPLGVPAPRRRYSELMGLVGTEAEYVAAIKGHDSSLQELLQTATERPTTSGREKSEGPKSAITSRGGGGLTTRQLARPGDEVVSKKTYPIDHKKVVMSGGTAAAGGSRKIETAPKVETTRPRPAPGKPAASPSTAARTGASTRTEKVFMVFSSSSGLMKKDIAPIYDQKLKSRDKSDLATAEEIAAAARHVPEIGLDVLKKSYQTACDNLRKRVGWDDDFLMSLTSPPKSVIAVADAVARLLDLETSDPQVLYFRDVIQKMVAFDPEKVVADGGAAAILSRVARSILGLSPEVMMLAGAAPKLYCTWVRAAFEYLAFLEGESLGPKAAFFTHGGAAAAAEIASGEIRDQKEDSLSEPLVHCVQAGEGIVSARSTAAGASDSRTHGEKMIQVRVALARVSLRQIVETEVSVIGDFVDLPAPVLRTMETVCVMLGEPLGWDTVKREVRNVKAFLERLRALEVEALVDSPEIMAHLDAFVVDPVSTPAVLFTMNRPAGLLRSWVAEMHECAKSLLELHTSDLGPKFAGFVGTVADIALADTTAGAPAASDLAATDVTPRDLTESSENEKARRMQAARDALCVLNKADMDEVKSYARPPPAVLMVMDAVCLLLREKTGWVSIRKLMVSSDFLLRLISYDFETLASNENLLKKLGAQIAAPGFRPETLQCVSKASSSLCSWVIAAHDLAMFIKESRPKPFVDEPLGPKFAGFGIVADAPTVTCSVEMLQTITAERGGEKAVVAKADKPTGEVEGAELSEIEEAMRGVAGKSLEDVKAAFEEATRDLHSADKKSLAEIRTLRLPPRNVILVLEAVIRFFDLGPGYSSKGMLGVCRAEFVDMMCEFDPEKVVADGGAAAILSRVARFMIDPDFNRESAMRTSLFGGWLCVWVRAAFEYLAVLEGEPLGPKAAFFTHGGAAADDSVESAASEEMLSGHTSDVSSIGETTAIPTSTE